MHIPTFAADKRISMKQKLHRGYRKLRYIAYRETMVTPLDHVLTFLGGFTGIALVDVLGRHMGFGVQDRLFLIGSFGASAVLVYGLVNSPLAQPRNLFGGHILSALVGVTVHRLLGGEDFPLWLAPATAVSAATVVMQVTKTLHPPGGATALIANIGSSKITGLGYMYVLSPVLAGVSVMFLVALAVNNLHKDRAYPKKWW